MKKINFITLLLLSFFMFNSDVLAANEFRVIPSVTSVTQGKKYSVQVKYTGVTLGSLRLNLKITNATCSVTSVASGGTSNCDSAICDVAYNNTAGYKSGVNLLTLSCSSSGSKASFSARLANNDAWDLEGLNEIAINNHTAYVNITPTTTTTKKPTTTTTRPIIDNGTVPTTKKTTTTTTTTKKSTTTSKTTTSNENVETKTTTTTTKTMGTTLLKTTEATTTSTIFVPEDMKLNQLKIVGYDLPFKPNCTNYKITIDPNVTELYIIADPKEETSTVESTGIIDIKDKNEIKIKVQNEMSGNELTYTIELDRKQARLSIFSIDIIDIILFITLIITIIVIVIATHSNKKMLSREERTNVNDDDVVFFEIDK